MKLFIFAAAFFSLLPLESTAHSSHARTHAFGQPPILEHPGLPPQPLNLLQKSDRGGTASIQTDSVYLSGRIVEVDLEITERILSPAGKPVRALAINGTVPGPRSDSMRVMWLGFTCAMAWPVKKPHSTGTACSCRTIRMECPI